METYIIVKKAIYDHGVMWIGSDIEEGKKKSDFFASNHDDGHHQYELRKFNEPKPSRESDYDYKPDWQDGCDVVYVGVDSRAAG